jgi:hypothetical protein
MKSLCWRNYYWNSAVTWIDDQRVAIEGIGEDDEWMIGGVRIFDVTQSGSTATRSNTARELASFAGPAGSFLSDGTWLYSSDESGLSRWDLNDGSRTGHLPQFNPTHYHRAAGELVELRAGALVRLNIAR